MRLESQIGEFGAPPCCSLPRARSKMHKLKTLKTTLSLTESSKVWNIRSNLRNPCCCTTASSCLTTRLSLHLTVTACTCPSQHKGKNVPGPDSAPPPAALPSALLLLGDGEDTAGASARRRGWAQQSGPTRADLAAANTYPGGTAAVSTPAHEAASAHTAPDASGGPGSSISSSRSAPQRPACFDPDDDDDEGSSSSASRRRAWRTTPNGASHAVATTTTTAAAMAGNITPARAVEESASSAPGGGAGAEPLTATTQHAGAQSAPTTGQQHAPRRATAAEILALYDNGDEDSAQRRRAWARGSGGSDQEELSPSEPLATAGQPAVLRPAGTGETLSPSAARTAQAPTPPEPRPPLRPPAPTTRGAGAGLGPRAASGPDGTLLVVHQEVAGSPVTGAASPAPSAGGLSPPPRPPPPTLLGSPQDSSHGAAAAAGLKRYSHPSPAGHESGISSSCVAGTDKRRVKSLAPRPTSFASIVGDDDKGEAQSRRRGWANRLSHAPMSDDEDEAQSHGGHPQPSAETSSVPLGPAKVTSPAPGSLQSQATAGESVPISGDYARGGQSAHNNNAAATSDAGGSSADSSTVASPSLAPPERPPKPGRLPSHSTGKQSLRKALTLHLIGGGSDSSSMRKGTPTPPLPIPSLSTSTAVADATKPASPRPPQYFGDSDEEEEGRSRRRGWTKSSQSDAADDAAGGSGGGGAAAAAAAALTASRTGSARSGASFQQGTGAGAEPSSSLAQVSPVGSSLLPGGVGGSVLASPRRTSAGVWVHVFDVCLFLLCGKCGLVPPSVCRSQFTALDMRVGFGSALCT